jgi:hypothetical protein
VVEPCHGLCCGGSIKEAEKIVDIRALWTGDAAIFEAEVGLVEQVPKS